MMNLFDYEMILSEGIVSEWLKWSMHFQFKPNDNISYDSFYYISVAFMWL